MDYLLIAMAAFFIRVLPVIRNDRIDFDTYGHLYYASAIREQKKNPWDSIKIQCWAGENFSHPFLVHWLLGRVKKNIVLTYQKIINPTLDTLFSIFIYQGSIAYFEGSKKIGLICVLLYMFTPMWFSKISMGPRVHNFTPRLITEIAFPMLIYFGLYKSEAGNELQVIVCQILLIMLILNSTKFGVQVIIFMVPIISTINSTPKLTLSAILAIIITTIVSKGKFYNQIRRQVAHLIEYYHSNRKNETSTTDRNRFEKINLRKITSRDEVRKLIYCYLYNNSYTAVITKMPVIVLAIANLVYGISNQQSVFSIGNGVLLSTLIIYFFINQRRFLFLGEAERYLNHISLVIIFEAVAFSQRNNNFLPIYLILAYGILFWAVENSYFVKITNSVKRNLADNEIELILKKIVGEKIVCTYSFHNFCVYRIMLNTHHKVIFPYHMEQKISREFIAKYQYNYPYINLNNIEDMCAETRCNVLIIDNYSADVKELDGIKLEEGGWSRIELSYDVYKLYSKNGD